MKAFSSLGKLAPPTLNPAQEQQRQSEQTLLLELLQSCSPMDMEKQELRERNIGIVADRVTDENEADEGKEAGKGQEIGQNSSAGPQTDLPRRGGGAARCSSSVRGGKRPPHGRRRVPLPTKSMVAFLAGLLRFLLEAAQQISEVMVSNDIHTDPNNLDDADYSMFVQLSQPLVARARTQFQALQHPLLFVARLPSTTWD